MSYRPNETWPEIDNLVALVAEVERARAAERECRKAYMTTLAKLIEVTRAPDRPHTIEEQGRIVARIRGEARLALTLLDAIDEHLP